MKKYGTLIVLSLLTSVLFSQDIRLNDSVIFINDKPVALYAKELSQGTLRYNMEVYSFDDNVLIKAEVIRFNNPVPELAPFYYYELTFPPVNDTFSIYTEEPLLMALTKMIGEYDLINKNELNKKNLARLIQDHPGGPALIAKIDSFTNHLDLTRDYSLQVIRDRSKPVIIDESGIIIQDNVQIGKAIEVTRFLVTERPLGTADPYYNKPVYDIPGKVLADPVVTTVKKTEVYFVNGNILDERKISLYLYTGKKDLKTGFDLYEISKSKQKNKTTEVLLKHVCHLIENMML